MVSENGNGNGDFVSPFQGEDIFGGMLTQGGAEYRLPWANMHWPYRPKEKTRTYGMQPQRSRDASLRDAGNFIGDIFFLVWVFFLPTSCPSRDIQIHHSAVCILHFALSPSSLTFTPSLRCAPLPSSLLGKSCVFVSSGDFFGRYSRPLLL